MSGFDNDVMYANNADFSTAGATGGSAANGLATNGQLWIGTTSVNAGGTHINVGAITSPLGTVSIGYSTPNITLDISGGAPAIERINLQTGTTPVVPSSGNITFDGAVVAAGTNPVRSDGTGANTMALEVQISQAIAATDATKIGLSNFNSAHFSVDANGFVSLTGGGQAIDSFTTDLNGPVSPNASGNVAFTGATNIFSNGSVANTMRLELQGTNHALFVGRGASTASASLATGSSGQILQSAGAGADPAWTTSTYPSTNAQGDLIYGSALNVLSTLAKDTNATRYLSNTGVTNNPAWAQVNLANGVTGVLPVANGGTNSTGITGIVAGTGTVYNGRTITAGAGISVSNGDGVSGNPTISATGGGISWTEVTGTSQAMAVNSGYILNNAGLVTATLPSSAAVGDVVWVVGKGTGGWRIAQNAGQTIHFGNQNTTTGAGGRLDSTNRYDAIQLLCTIATTDWTCTGISQGNITVT